MSIKFPKTFVNTSTVKKAAATKNVKQGKMFNKDVPSTADHHRSYLNDKINSLKTSSVARSDFKKSQAAQRKKDDNYSTSTKLNYKRTRNKINNAY